MGIDVEKFKNCPTHQGMSRGSADVQRVRNKIATNHEPQQNKASREEFFARQQEIMEKLQELTNKFRASYSYEDEQDLRDYAKKYHLQNNMYGEVEKDERSEIARIAFNGTVERPNGGYSQAYQQIVNYPYKFANVQHSKEEYNLDDSGLWKVMKQFPEFASIKNRIVAGLAKAGVPPEMLPQMNMNDFRHLLFNQCSVGQSTSFAKIFPQLDENGNIVRDFRTQKPITTSAKQRNTISFINKHPEFAEVMMRVPGARKDYVDELVRQMKKGNTDMTKFLKDHEEWKDQIAVNMHHIINIKDIRLLEERGLPPSAINSEDNMCVVACGTLAEVAQKKIDKHSQKDASKNIHDSAIHGNDTTFRNNKVYRKKWGQHDTSETKGTIMRMEPAPGVCCMVAIGDEFTVIDQDRLQRFKEQEKLREQNKVHAPKAALEAAKKGNDGAN